MARRVARLRRSGSFVPYRNPLFSFQRAFDSRQESGRHIVVANRLANFEWCVYWPLVQGSAYLYFSIRNAEGKEALVGDADAFHEGVESGVYAQTFEQRMDFEIHEESFVLLKRPIQPFECRILLSQTRVNARDKV